jgi:large subunit ribosomal protein L23
MADSTTKPVGLQLEPHQVVLRPLVTEKGTHQSDRYNSYTFEVHPQATKRDVKQAVELLFNVRVTRVHTQMRKGKPRRYRARFTYQRDWKKAIVTLHEEDRISFF